MKKYFSGVIKFYQKYNSLDFEECVDFFSNKILIGLFVSLLYVIASIIRHSNISGINIICLFIIGFNSLDIILYILKKRIYMNMENDMLNAIIIMNNAFKSGKSTIQAVEVASQKLKGPLKHEFKKILKEMQYGLTIEVVFDRFSKRVNVDSAAYVSTSLITLSKTGGNIVKVFNSIERTLFDRKKLEEELKSTTTASNFVVKILTIVPFILVIAIYILSPAYFSPLFESVVGYLIIAITSVIFVLYLIILNRVVKVDY